MVNSLTIYAPNDTCIAVAQSSNGINEAKANARLIAAAPDLLEALECALADLEGALQAKEQGGIQAHDWKAHELSIEEARAAIAKARGQS